MPPHTDQYAAWLEELKQAVLWEEASTYPPLWATDFDTVERTLNVVLPNAYRRWHALIAGIEFPNWELYRVLPATHPRIEPPYLRDIVLVQSRLRAIDLPKFLVSFCTDGLGNETCFDTRHRTPASGHPVISWEHEIAWSPDLEDPEDAIMRLAPDFEHWLRNEINRKIELAKER